MVQYCAHISFPIFIIFERFCNFIKLKSCIWLTNSKYGIREAWKVNSKYLILHIFFHKLKIWDRICGAYKFGHILIKCGKFVVCFASVLVSEWVS